MATGGDYFVYHEKQDSSLCGQHALNTLLQGPYFTAVDLAGWYDHFHYLYIMAKGV
jgi:hypothetical protein